MVFGSMMAKSGPKVEVPVTAEMWSKMGKLAFGMEELMPKTAELSWGPKQSSRGPKQSSCGPKQSI